MKHSLRRDLQHRAEVRAESLATNVERDLERDTQHSLRRTVQHFANREHLSGLTVYDTHAQPIVVTASLESLMATPPSVVAQALKENQGTDAFVRMGGKVSHVYALPLQRPTEVCVHGLLRSRPDGTCEMPQIAFYVAQLHPVSP